MIPIYCDIPDSPKQKAAYISRNVKHLNKEAIFLDSFMVGVERVGRNERSLECIQVESISKLARRSPNGFDYNLRTNSITQIATTTWKT